MPHQCARAVPGMFAGCGPSAADVSTVGQRPSSTTVTAIVEQTDRPIARNAIGKQIASHPGLDQ